MLHGREIREKGRVGQTERKVKGGDRGEGEQEWGWWINVEQVGQWRRH